MVTTIIGTVLGDIYGVSSTYATANNTSSSSGSSIDKIGQGYSPPNYTCRRGYVSFNTSTLVGRFGRVRMGVLYGRFAVLPTTADDLKIVQYNFAGKTFASNREEMYDAVKTSPVDKGYFNTTAVRNYAYSTPLDLDYINRSGTTYYAFATSRDIAGTAPSTIDYYDDIVSQSDDDPWILVFDGIIASPSSNGYSGGPMMFKSPRDLLRVLKKPLYSQTASPRKVCSLFN